MLLVLFQALILVSFHANAAQANNNHNNIDENADKILAQAPTPQPTRPELTKENAISGPTTPVPPPANTSPGHTAAAADWKWVIVVTTACWAALRPLIGV